MPQNDSFYRINYDTLEFSDIRMDKIRHNIKPIFDKIAIIETFNTKLHSKLQDCRHKMEAVWYSLLLIQNEIIHSERTDIKKLKKYSSMVWMCPKTEFKNDVLIFETESFLFQIKSGLDILIQAMKYIYPCLDKHHSYDSESFEVDYNWTSKTTSILRVNEQFKIADFFELEIEKWILEMINVRNIITHRSWLNWFLCFVLHEKDSILDKPKMPSGENLDEYCQHIYSNLLGLYKTIFEEFILVELKDFF